MQVGITRIDPSLPLPSYGSVGAAGFDLYCRVDIEIEPGALARLATNVIIAVPDGYFLMVALRSGTPQRKGLLSPHGVGIIDQDYRGLEDEVLVQVYNFGGEAVRISRGERIAQGLLVPIDRCEWEERPATARSRGGFGSTG